MRICWILGHQFQRCWRRNILPDWSGWSSEFEGLQHSVDEFSNMLKNSYSIIPIFIFSFEKKQIQQQQWILDFDDRCPPHIFGDVFFSEHGVFGPRGCLVFHGNRWSNSSTSRSWRGWTANSRHRHEQQMRQQWQQERKLFKLLAGGKGEFLLDFFEWEALQMSIKYKNSLELPVVADRLELKLPSSFNLN